MATEENEKKETGELDLTAAYEQSAGRDELVKWVMDKVGSWEDWRNDNYRDAWNQYYRMWRGVWAAEDKSRDSERSRVVPPALSQAVEAAVAEQEEAIFANKNWFDIADDYQDQNPQDVMQLRNLLLEDMDWNGVPAAVSEVFLLAALYGTGIAKILVEEDTKKKVVNYTDPKMGVRVDAIEENEYTKCRLEPVSPENFVIDPTVMESGTEGIQNALGVAHIVTKPRYTIADKQREGTYFRTEVGSFEVDEVDLINKGETTFDNMDDKTKIVEYYGKVPKELFDLAYQDSNETAEPEEDEYEDEFVEAIITIANDSILLRCVKNEFLMEDRPFVAYSFERVPGRFWGRGVCEMGYNSQQALTAMHRAQLDGLALSVHPMLAIDASKIPRGTNFKVSPGRTVLINGNPNESMREFRFPGIDNASWNATADLERYIQMGTGSMDSASPLRANRRNETMGGMSMIMGGVMKRSKRILQNIERSFLIPMIEKMLYRYFQFNPTRYKPQDFKFKVVGGLGMMAREVETQQLVNLIGFVPPQSPAFFAILAGIINNTSIQHKDAVLAAIQQGMQPDPAEQAANQAQAEKTQMQTQEIGSRIQHRNAQTAKIGQSMEMDQIKTMTNILGKGNGSK